MGGMNIFFRNKALLGAGWHTSESVLVNLNRCKTKKKNTKLSWSSHQRKLINPTTLSSLFKLFSSPTLYWMESYPISVFTHHNLVETLMFWLNMYSNTLHGWLSMYSNTLYDWQNITVTSIMIGGTSVATPEQFAEYTVNGPCSQ